MNQEQKRAIDVLFFYWIDGIPEDVLVFDFIYIKLELGRNVLPVELCMKYAGLFIDSLPSELNRTVALYLYPSSTFNMGTDGYTLLLAFRQRHPVLFNQYLIKFLEIMKTPIDMMVVIIKSIAVRLYIDEALKIRPILLYIIKYYSTSSTSLLEFCNRQFRDDYEIVRNMVEKNGRNLEHASDTLKDNKNIVVLATYWILQYASERLRDDKEVALIAVKQNSAQLQFASNRLKDDWDVAMAAVKDDGLALVHTSPRLRNEAELVKIAMKENVSAMQYAGNDLKDDTDFVMTAVQCNGMCLEYASDRLRDDKNIVMAAVQSYGWALEYASDRLRDDRNIVMAAVQFYSWCLQYASDRLRDDAAIVMVAN